MTNKLLHRLFAIGIWLKGIDGMLEIAGGVLLRLASPTTIGQLVTVLTQHELARDPDDVIAGALQRAASHLTPEARSFGSAYLIGHGLVKVLLAVALLRNHLRAYPAAMLFLAGFIGYQAYRLSYHYSLALLILTVLDAIIVILVWREYRRQLMERRTGLDEPRGAR